MSVRDKALRARIHAVTESLVGLEVHIYERLGDSSTGVRKAYDLETLLEATRTLRDAFDGFIQTAVKAEASARTSR